MPRQVFVTGGTGYLGPLVAERMARGHTVQALVRPGSERLPDGALPVSGNALDASTFVSHVRPSDTLVHLVGTPRNGLRVIEVEQIRSGKLPT